MKRNIIIINDDKIDLDIYTVAFNLSKKLDSDTTKVKNPYPEGTQEFYSWNRGWNAYYNREWNKKSI